ncbi:hypothetical protein BDP55DRAFT_417440 [Colletotrichum godetiae]|uniref:Uncharacterized protein n=1 Tax=Colletotrichum godetiae TaxID=1209918 RepID=A0AAJ0EQV6_9PEZI|nr:uncharacterized protein BDP55DRAFT_417440 [Colletotrichum godetiae]KAK1657858.1 hypothetical protein BDP55DRAFT_417440 [Colletotrichum godetiae]
MPSAAARQAQDPVFYLLLYLLSVLRTRLPSDGFSGKCIESGERHRARREISTNRRGGTAHSNIERDQFVFHPPSPLFLRARELCYPLTGRAKKNKNSWLTDVWACEGEAAGVAEVGMGRDLGKAGKGRMRWSGCAGHPRSCTDPGLGSRGGRCE